MRESEKEVGKVAAEVDRLLDTGDVDSVMPLLGTLTTLQIAYLGSEKIRKYMNEIDLVRRKKARENFHTT